jgi:hypothetical protein
MTELQSSNIDNNLVEDNDKARAMAEASDGLRSRAASLRRASNYLLEQTVSAPVQEQTAFRLREADDVVAELEEQGVTDASLNRQRDDLVNVNLALTNAQGNVVVATERLRDNASDHDTVARQVEDQAAERYDSKK